MPGGPSLGDLRSRLVRLAGIAIANPDPSSRLSMPHSREALHRLLAYRLPMDGPLRNIKQEWLDILEGKHYLWQGIDAEKRECVRGFLVQFESDVLHRAHRNFNFRGGSIGNFLLSAMQRFFRSIQSAIFLFAALVGIPHALPECHVLPAINTNKTTTIAAELSNGSTLVGQCEISHPAQPRKTGTTDADWSLAPTRRTSPEPVDMTPTGSSRAIFAANESPAKTPQRLPPSGAARASASNASSAHSMDDSDFSDEEELAPSIYQDSMESALGNLAFSKLDEMTALESPIRRTSRPRSPRHLLRERRSVRLTQSFQNEVFPVPHPSYILGLNRSRVLVYSW